MASQAKFQIVVPLSEQQRLEDLLEPAFAGARGVLGVGQSYDPLVDQYYYFAGGDPPEIPPLCGFEGSAANADVNELKDLQDQLEAWWTGNFNGQFSGSGGTKPARGTGTPVNWTMGDVTGYPQAVINDSNTWMSRENWRAAQAVIWPPNGIADWQPPSSPTAVSASLPPLEVKLWVLHDALTDERPSQQLWSIATWDGTRDDRFFPAVPETQTEDRPVRQWLYNSTVYTHELRQAFRDRGDRIPDDMHFAVSNLNNELVYTKQEGIVENGQISVNRVMNRFDLRQVGRQQGYTQDQVEDFFATG
jgi:hypothetical protein